ncbi:MAG TPA: zf-HC2 domain-containing protein [Casimicrobiaceae bacterium]|nr:zf-HC2 domain-containing protein [Casimicrobiaceae bacterium]
MFHRLTHLLSCKEATRLMSQAQDRPLGYAERVKLRLHLAACTACTRFSRQMTLLREAMSRYRA